jgi:hypothetical protein
VRRIDLRADAVGWLTESLPHELTHVVLADRFSEQRIPHWADEGIAILSESVGKQQLRERTWLAETQFGKQLSVHDLFSVTAHPPSNRLNSFYGRSASLVRFLVAQRTHEHFVGFVEAVEKQGPVKALREWYGFDSIEQLEREWAARRSAPTTGVLLGDRTPRSSRSDGPIAD